jgi:GT2 family glycosyltransferase
MNVSITVPVWNDQECLSACLGAILARVGLDDEVVVDNASTDGSTPLVREQCPQVRLIENARDLGFAGGCNAGLRAALGE